MATAGAETVEVASQRAELQSVLSSQAFVRAPRLAHLLSYLCEKLFAGEAGQIKEFSLALHASTLFSAFPLFSPSFGLVHATRLLTPRAFFSPASPLPHAQSSLS